MKIGKKSLCFLLLAALLLSLVGCTHEHEFGEWTVTREATCTEDGLKERSCSCGEVETEVLPATGHSFGEWKVLEEATVVSEGAQERVCSVCGTTETEVIPELAEVTETEHVKLLGVYVDNSYRDKDESSMRLLYIVYEVSGTDRALSVSSKLSKLSFGGVDTYSSEKYNFDLNRMCSFHYSDYIATVNKGETLKIICTFKVPEAELVAGQPMTLTLEGIPDGEQLLLKTDRIVFCDTPEEIAQTVDPDEYSAYLQRMELADDATTTMVRSAVNGYYWRFYVNSFTYELEFYSPNNFEIRLPSYNISNTGTYLVRNGYIALCYEPDVSSVEIPWTWENDDISLDCADAFDVH